MRTAGCLVTRGSSRLHLDESLEETTVAHQCDEQKVQNFSAQNLIPIHDEDAPVESGLVDGDTRHLNELSSAERASHLSSLQQISKTLVEAALGADEKLRKTHNGCCTKIVDGNSQIIVNFCCSKIYIANCFHCNPHLSSLIDVLGAFRYLAIHHREAHYAVKSVVRQHLDLELWAEVLD